MGFEKLNVEDLPKVRPLLVKKLPSSTMVLNILDLSIKLKGNYLDKVVVEIYAYNGASSNEDNLFLVIFLKPNETDITSVIFAPDEIPADMILSFSNLYDWSKSYVFAAITAPFSQHLEKIVEDKGGKISKGPAADMYLPIEDALKLDLTRVHLNKEFELDKLGPEHTSMVNTHWRYGGDVEEKVINSAITYLGGASGIFKKSETGDKLRDKDNLVSWIVFLRIGTFNALHTLEDYRGKGLGRWTMEAATKWIAEQGLIPLCEIEPYNDTSRRLVERIGYKLIHDVFWMKYEPPNCEIKRLE